jgi:hypothetical protein
MINKYNSNEVTLNYNLSKKFKLIICFFEFNDRKYDEINYLINILVLPLIK